MVASSVRVPTAASPGRCEKGSAGRIRWRWLVIGVCGAATLMSVGLLHSYSRGAWVGFLCGLSYLGYHAMRVSDSRDVRTVQWIRRNGANLAVVMCTLAVLCFYQIRHSD